MEAPSPDCPIPVIKSSGCVVSNEGIGMPSITYNALLFPERDFAPRITTFAPPPIPDELELITTPAILPDKLFTKLASLTPTISLADTSCTL